VFSLDDPRLEGFWSRAAKLGIPVDVQVRYHGLDAVERVLRRHPDVPIILDHMSSPPVSDGPPYRGAADLFDLAAYEQLYLKFANHNLDAADEGSSTAETFLEHLLERFGESRMMWARISPTPSVRLPPPKRRT